LPDGGVGVIIVLCIGGDWREMITTRLDEIGCDECLEQLDRFVEMTLAGKNAAEAMPLV
jgi:hypothetical protein